MFLGIEHFGLMAKDTAKLANWYEKNFQFRVVYKNQKQPPTFFIVGKEGSLLEILPYSNSSKVITDEAKSSVHLAIAVSDFEQAVADLKARGVEFSGEPKINSEGVKVIAFRDPEGNYLQLIYRPNALK